MTRPATWICALCVLWPTAPVRCQVAGCELELSNYSARYIAGEMVWFYLEIRNASQDSLSIGYPHAEPNLRIIGPDGRYVPHHMTHTPSILMLPERLAPGRGKRFVVWQGAMGNSGRFTGGFDDFLPGSYRAWFTLDSSKSNEVTFHVVSPSQAEQVLHDSIMCLDEVKHRMNSQEVAQEYRLLLRTHAGSRYVPNLYWKCLRYSSWTAPPESTIALGREFIDRYPTNPAIQQAVDHIALALLASAGVTQQTATKRERDLVRRALQSLAAAYPESFELAYYVELFSHFYR